MTRFTFLFFLCFSIFSNVRSQDSETLITIGKTVVTKGEFERIYRKNNTNLYNKEDKKSPSEYLDLFIDFKLKVLEAQRLKMDTSTAFITELKGYRDELAAPYLTDVKYNEEMVKELYERTTKEVNASHILIAVNHETEEDNKYALDKIRKIREEIVAGKEFSEAAFEHSEDPSARTNRGNLGYFTAFQMVVPFENAAFNTPVGQVSEPVKTDFGYHLIFVHDIRENKGEIKVAHIMKMFTPDTTPAMKMKLRTQIDSLYQLLLNGADFAELAKANSDDKRSGALGGEMEWFASGRIIPSFSNAAFSIKNVGDFTRPIETEYGFHIIKKLDVRPVPSFEETKTELEERIKRDPQRSITSKMAFVDKLKSEYNYTENKEGIAKLDGKVIGNEFEEADFELFKINDKSYGLKQLQAFIEEGKIVSNSYNSIFEYWVEDEITKLEDSLLEEKYPDFKYLIQEYHDGILLFNISEEKIWNFASQDSVGLQKFYDNSLTRHLWEERFKGMIITCKTAQAREDAEKYFAEEMPAEEIAELINKNENLFEYTEGAWEKGGNPVVDYYVWNGELPENFDPELIFIRGDKIQPEPKSLDEARGLYISDYQKFLEENWIKELRKKYKVKVNKKLLKTIDSV